MGVVGGAEAAGLTAAAERSGLDVTGRDGSGLAGGAGGSDQDCGAERLAAGAQARAPAWHGPQAPARDGLEAR